MSSTAATRTASRVPDLLPRSGLEDDRPEGVVVGRGPRSGPASREFRQRAAGSASIVAIIRLRIAASGRRPRPPPRLSAIFFAWLVAGVTTVIAGWLATNLMKNCAHVVASNSLA